MNLSIYSRLAAVILLSVAAQSALANQINTGGRSGAYFDRFCPPLQSALKKAKFDYECATSQGSRENIQRVLNSPDQLSYSQFDVYALETTMLGSDNAFATLRSDVARECLFMVTKNRDITSYGEIASLAPDLRFILPPEKSGSAATFAFLQQIDPDGLGLAAKISYADSVDDAIGKALSADDTVTLFVQFPDPENARFKKISDMEGHSIPVIDRNILRQQIRGEKIYFAQETEVSNPKWHESAPRVITSCTPMVIFTGASDRIADETARRDHEDLVKTIKTLSVEDLQPKVGFFKSLWKKTRKLSAASVEKMIEASEEAREAAGPMMEKAKKKSQELMEQASEIADQARVKAEELAEQAKQKSEELMEKAKEATE